MRSKRLVEAMKQKYGTARNAMLALDLDPALLREDYEDDRADDRRRHADDRRRRADDRRHDADDRLPRARIGRDLERPVERFREDLTSHRMPTEERVEARDDDPDEFPQDPHRYPPSEQRMSDDRRISLDDFMDYLRSHSDMSEDELNGAMDIVRDHMRKRSSNGHDRRRADDRREARDRFPQRAHHSPLADPDKEAARDNWGGNDPDEGKFLVRHGLDGIGSRGRTALDEMRKNLARIEHEPEARELSGVTSRRRRQGMDAKPKVATEAQTARLHQRFPNLSLIGDASSDGVGVASRRGQYEV